MRGGPFSETGSGALFPGLLADLEAAVAAACTGCAEWPAQVAAGIYAGVDFAVSNPLVVESLMLANSDKRASQSRYERVVQRLARLIAIDAPARSQLPGATDEALVAGIVGLVGDHVRIGRGERLLELRPDLVLLALLPYLGFTEARGWANRFANDPNFN